MIRFPLAAMVLALGLAGCGVVEMPSRGAGLPLIGPGHAGAAMPAAPGHGYVVTDLHIDVPDDLRVSEANVYYPIADIVWRGDPHGDRREQVAQIFRDGFGQAQAVLKGGPETIAEVEVERFHAVTEKARYTIGGVHSVRFILTLRDPVTGAVLDGPRRIKADMRASGGAKALAEDAAGYTQRVAVTTHLAEVLTRELALAGPAPLPGAAALSTRDAGAEPGGLAVE